MAHIFVKGALESVALLYKWNGLPVIFPVGNCRVWLEQSMCIRMMMIGTDGSMSKMAKQTTLQYPVPSTGYSYRYLP